MCPEAGVLLLLPYMPVNFYETPIRMKIADQIKNILKSVMLFGVGYAAIYFGNNFLTEFLYVLPGAHLVHIPSGFKLLFTIIGRWSAALAIGCVSFLNGYFYMFAGDAVLNVQLAGVCGFVPMLTWLFFKHRYHLEDNLANITFRSILLMGLFFALLNSSMIQLVLFWSGIHKNFLQGFAASAIGDITGLYIVMGLIKIGARFLTAQNPKYPQ